MIDTLIKNANVLTMKNADVLRGGCVGIDGGKIVYVGSHPQNEAEYSHIIDAHGGIVMPGLVNAHAHTAMCVMRGYADDYPLQQWLYEKVFPVEARLTESAIVAGARLGMAEMLSNGITSFSDMYFCQPAVANTVAEVGMRANLCNAVIALGDDYVFEKDRAVIETNSLIKDWHNAEGGLIRADVSIHAEYTSPPSVWERVHAIAEEFGLVTHIHLSETRREQAECVAKYGMTPAAILDKHGVFDTPVLAAHCVWLTENDMDMLAAHGVSAAHCPVSNLKLGSGIANVREMLRRGINVCLGTDGSCSNNSLDLFQEVKLAALLAKGTSLDPTAVTAFEALEMATVRGARAQGRGDTVGIIAEGYDADLIILDVGCVSMFPMYGAAGAAVYSAASKNVALTMVRGRVLYERGEWTTIDVERAMSEVKNIAIPIVLGSDEL